MRRWEVAVTHGPIRCCPHPGCPGNSPAITRTRVVVEAGDGREANFQAAAAIKRGEGEVLNA